MITVYLLFQAIDIQAIDKPEKENGMDKRKKQSGSVTLETIIVLPVFLFLFLFIFSLFPIVKAQNEMMHALVQSTKSLSLDSYLSESVHSLEDSNGLWANVSDMVIDIIRVMNTDNHYTYMGNWYKTTNPDPNIAKMRFVGYLAGGDEAVADKILRSFGVTNGLDGVEFKMEVKEGLLSVTIKYEIGYIFDFIKKIPMEQTITSKLWAVSGSPH